MSAILEQAFANLRTLRAEFEEYREAQYLRAEEACRGVLLNARGERAGISAYSLFLGSGIRARAYASEELLEWWATHPRLSFAEYERQRVEVAPW